MDAQKLIQKINHLYQRFKKQIGITLIFLLMFTIYLSPLLGDWYSHLIPSIISLLVALMFETLLSVEEKLFLLKQPKFFEDMASSTTFLCEALEMDRDITVIDLIAATGGTMRSSVIPLLVKRSRANIVEINLHVINPFTPPDHIPTRWPDEVKTTIAWLETNLKQEKFRVKVYGYTYLPNIHGTLINHKKLVIGFFSWKSNSMSQELTGSQREHIYYDLSNEEGRYFIQLFEDWLTDAPKELLYQSPS